MTKIYTFLQKRKMHENHHGIIMIMTAYILSFLMLFFGSDMFYNITSKAERIQNETNEETHELMNNNQLAVPIIEIKAHSLEYNTINSFKDSLKATKVLETEIKRKEVTEEETAKQKITRKLQITEMNTQTTDMKTQIANKDTQVTEMNTQTTDMDKETADIDKQTADIDKQATVIETQGDTVWLLGHSLSGSEYNAVLTHMDQFDSVSEKNSDNENISRGTIKAYSEAKKANAAARGITNVEIGMLERIVEAEATGEDMVGRILIANVIFNRVMSGKFPDSVKGVIFQKSDDDYQFSPVCDRRFWSVNVSEKTKKAVSRALAGEDYSDGALYFMARRGTSSNNARWFDHNLNRLFKHGGHEFYK